MMIKYLSPLLTHEPSTDYQVKKLAEKINEIIDYLNVQVAQAECPHKQPEWFGDGYICTDCKKEQV